MIKFAFYGRVSTEDQQDPESSRGWQLTRSRALIEAHKGVIVTEFFDVDKSRSLAALKNPKRGLLGSDLMLQVPDVRVERRLRRCAAVARRLPSKPSEMQSCGGYQDGAVSSTVEMSHPQGQGVNDDRDRKGTNAPRAGAAPGFGDAATQIVARCEHSAHSTEDRPHDHLR
jgi:hypothetical protein